MKFNASEQPPLQGLYPHVRRLEHSGPKHQAPTTKLQGRSKSQAPIRRRSRGLALLGSHKQGRSRSTSRRRLKFGAWCFPGVWCLEFGAWGRDAFFEKESVVAAVSSGIMDVSTGEFRPFCPTL